MTGEVDGNIASRSGPEQTHEFVRVRNYYVNSSLGVLQLGRYLWQQMDQFLGSEGKSPPSRRTERVLAGSTLKASRIARHLAGFLLARSSGDDRDDRVLRLPVRGDIAIVRRSGAVKVLDVHNRQVFTVVLNGEERKKLRERVGFSKSVAHLPFAPSIGQVELDLGYFSEEFLSGRHPLNFAGCKDDFGDVYRPLLTQFLTAFEPRMVELGEYAGSLRNDILSPDGLLEKMEPAERAKVSTFVERIWPDLEGEEVELPLVLSHGDYFSGNIVIDSSGFRAIDWANAGFRSPLHDLYYLYMNHCCRVLDWRSVARRVRLASEGLKEALRHEDPSRFAELEEFLVPGDLLRKLFYLECVQVPLVRCTDPEDRYLASMLVRIGWFEEYEREMRGERGRRPAGSSAHGSVAADLDVGI